jgi:hypothetical protein
MVVLMNRPMSSISTNACGRKVSSNPCTISIRYTLELYIEQQDQDRWEVSISIPS